MTLIIAIKCRDGVVIASDGMVTIEDEFRKAKKLYKIGKHLIMGAAGNSGVIKRIVNHLNGLVHDIKREKSIRKIESKLVEIYRYHKENYRENYDTKDEFEEDFNGDLLVIDDSNIYRFDFDGYPEPCDNYEAIGGASGYVLTLLENFYENNIDIERAEGLAVYCILQAMKVTRDIGEPIQIGVVQSGKEAKILEANRVKEIVEKTRRIENLLHEVWNVLSRFPESQEEIGNLIERYT